MGRPAARPHFPKCPSAGCLSLPQAGLASIGFTCRSQCLPHLGPGTLPGGFSGGRCGCRAWGRRLRTSTCRRGHRQYLRSGPPYDFPRYRSKVHEVTQAFAAVSREVLAVEAELAGPRAQPLLAGHVRSLQQLEQTRLATVRPRSPAAARYSKPGLSRYPWPTLCLLGEGSLSGPHLFLPLQSSTKASFGILRLPGLHFSVRFHYRFLVPGHVHPSQSYPIAKCFPKCPAYTILLPLGFPNALGPVLNPLHVEGNMGFQATSLPCNPKPQLMVWVYSSTSVPKLCLLCPFGQSWPKYTIPRPSPREATPTSEILVQPTSRLGLRP